MGNPSRVPGHRASTLLRRPVVLRGIRLGEIEGVLLDSEAPRVLGFDVLCGDGANRFLPFGASRPRDGAIEIESSLTLLEPRELAFYRERGRSLAAVPELGEAVLEPDGMLVTPLSAAS
jgi:PRC-barrel domain protein